MGKEKMVSIVILNWNGKQDTAQCIDSIYKSTSYKNFEIILVDNGSSDGSVGMLKEMKREGRVHGLILNSENKGFGGANNQGMKIAKGEYVFLLNNDTIVTKNWLKKLVEAAEGRSDAGIVGPRFPLAESPNAPDGGGYTDDAGRGVVVFTDREQEAETVSGGAFLIKRAVLEKIGFFDPGFFPIYFEETDYCARARKAGFKVLFTPKSTILHNESAATRKQASKWRFMAVNKNRLRYMLLHFPKSRLVKSFFLEVARFGRDLAHLRAHWLVETWLINLKNLPGIVKKRRAFARGELFEGAKKWN